MRIRRKQIAKYLCKFYSGMSHKKIHWLSNERLRTIVCKGEQETNCKYRAICSIVSGCIKIKPIKKLDEEDFKNMNKRFINNDMDYEDYGRFYSIVDGHVYAIDNRDGKHTQIELANVKEAKDWLKGRKN